MAKTVVRFGVDGPIPLVRRLPNQNLICDLVTLQLHLSPFLTWRPCQQVDAILKQCMAKKVNPGVVTKGIPDVIQIYIRQTSKLVVFKSSLQRRKIELSMYLAWQEKKPS